MTFKINEDADFAKSLEAFYRKRGYSDLEKVRAALDAYAPKIERAIAEAVAAERERCAKVCEGLSVQWGKCCNPKLSDKQYWEGKSNAALDCAETIRNTSL